MEQQSPSLGSRDVRLLEIRDLQKSYVHSNRTIHVLKGINITIQQGEMISIVGPSGVGKSTFLHVLGTLDAPTSGQVLVMGMDVFRFSEPALADFRNRTMGFVFQFHHLLPEFTALENVMMPALIQRRDKAEAEGMARKILEEVDLTHRLDHKPGELSGGEQQRVALARALVLGPRLILADEPTGNLDHRTGEGIHELFIKLNAELGVTLIIVTHNPVLAARMPRGLRMVDGVIEEEG